VKARRQEGAEAAVRAALKAVAAQVGERGSSSGPCDSNEWRAVAVSLRRALAVAEQAANVAAEVERRK
jgi:hypothetical protein